MNIETVFSLIRHSQLNQSNWIDMQKWLKNEKKISTRSKCASDKFKLWNCIEKWFSCTAMQLHSAAKICANASQNDSPIGPMSMVKCERDKATSSNEKTSDTENSVNEKSSNFDNAEGRRAEKRKEKICRCLLKRNEKWAKKKVNWNCFHGKWHSALAKWKLFGCREQKPNAKWN